MKSLAGLMSGASFMTFKWRPTLRSQLKLSNVSARSMPSKVMCVESPPAMRQQARQARDRPLVDELHDWFNKMLARLSPKSDTTVAIRYALTLYLDDGTIEIDNSAAERALCGVALGRKNYLFCGSDTGGYSAAAIYSLIGTAKLNGVESELYLQRVLEKISDWPISRISELLPWNFSEFLTNLA